MKAITVRQPYASLIAAGVKTVETRPRSTSYRGRIAIHAALRGPEHGMRVGECEVYYPNAPGFVRIPGDAVPMPLGAVVASAVLTDCVPIVPADDEVTEGRQVAVSTDGRYLWRRNGRLSLNIDDQLPYGVFAPGRWALLLDDIAPTTERCPWCSGTLGDPERYDEAWFHHGIAEPGSIPPCPVCVGDDGYPVGRCDPIPARGQQPVPWNWTP